MSFIVKSCALNFQGLYIRKIAGHAIYWTSFPLAAQYFKEDNLARVAMIEAGVWHFEVEPAHTSNREAFVPTPPTYNPPFVGEGKELVNSRI